MSRLLALVVVVAACGHGEPAPAKTTPPSEPVDVAQAPDSLACGPVAVNMVRVSRIDGDGGARMKAVLERRCEEDVWSQPARRCYSTARDWDEGLTCESKMSKAQLDALQRDIEAQGSTMGRQPPSM